MSVTTTDNVVTRNALSVLTDYELHHSGESGESGSFEGPNRRPDEQETDTSNNPEWWDDSHRRVPPHRPTNRNLDRDERPDGRNPIERLFVFTMLNGVGLTAGAAQLWRKSFGHFNDTFFRYKIGGER